MKTIKSSLICLLLVFLFNSINAQNHQLKFNTNKKFKIVQFTDLHIKYKDKRSDIAFAKMNEVLNAEKPDLILITGDIIYSKPAKKNLRSILDFISKYKIPFAVTFGNHDREQGLSNDKLFKIVKSYPYNVTIDEQPQISGVGNCALPIKTLKGKTAAVLYLIDSNRNSQIKEVGGYDYIRRDQINWYMERSKEFTANNNGKPLLSLAFFHIPLPEYKQALMDQNSSMYGIRREAVCAPNLNSGIFAAFKECGDVKGVFVGHDHDNDFAIGYQGVLLAYGRFTGGPTEYIHIPNGARVIELTKNSSSFKSWIRTSSTNIEQITTFPDDYVKK